MRDRSPQRANGRVVFANGCLSTAGVRLDKFRPMQRAQFIFPKSLIGQVFLASAFFAVFAVVLDPGDTEQLPILAEVGLWFTHFLAFAMLYLAGVRGAQRLRA